jgi:protein-S-isoprenylcysteine O-methyltransferase Ste14
MRKIFVPPPIVFTMCAALASWLADFTYQWHTSTALAASVLCAIGGYIAVSALILFRKAKTTIHPHKPQHTSSLVVEGIYTYTRNPMYLAMLCVLIAWCLLYVSQWGWVSVGIYIGFITRFQIIPEEEILRAKFGEDYEQYANQVRRWI